MSLLDTISQKAKQIATAPQQLTQKGLSVLDSVSTRIAEKQNAIYTPPEQLTARGAALKFAGQTNLTQNKEWLKIPLPVRQQAYAEMTKGQERYNSDGTLREDFTPQTPQKQNTYVSPGSQYGESGYKALGKAIGTGLVNSGNRTIKDIRESNARGEGIFTGALKDYANTVIGAGKFVAEQGDSLITGAERLALELNKKILPEKYGNAVQKDIQGALGGLESRQAGIYAPTNEKQRVGKAVAPFIAYSGLAGVSEGFIAKNILKGLSGYSKTLTASALSDLSLFAGVSGLQEAAQKDPSVQNWLKNTITNAALGVVAQRFLTKAPKVIDDALGSEGVKNFTVKLKNVVDKLKKQGLTPEQIEVKINELSNAPEIKELFGQKVLPLKADETFVSSRPKDAFLSGRADSPTLRTDTFNSSDYVKEQVNLRESARGVATKGKEAVKSFYKDAKSKLIDTFSPIEDLLAKSKKEYKFDVLPKADITNQIDRVLRSPTLAGQFVRDNGFDKIIKGVDSLENLDQYLIARQAKNLEVKGIKTGRNLESDSKLLSEFEPKYEETAKQVNAYSQKLLDYSVDSGLVSKELATKLKTEYPDYVPMNRVFDELEKSGQVRNTKAVASIGSQSVVQKIKGSERAVESPIESLLTKTNDAFRQGEVNKAAKILASYRELPLFKDVIKEVKPSENVAHKISFLDNGKKRVFEVSPELERAAKSLNVEQLNVLGRIFAAPVRLAKVGITGLNIPFIATNVVRDQLTAFINSSKGLKTSLANPLVFTKSLFNAVKHGDLYDDLVRSGAGGTSFDIARNQVTQTVAKIRSGKNLKSRIAYTVRHPSELFRAVEDIVGRGEELTRMQQFAGTRDALIKAGRSIDDATILAAKAARENTANFYRKGEWGNVLNSAFLYVNAAKEGSRAFIRSAARSPGKTAVKVATTVFLPTASATLWNLSDPERAKIYEDITESEKENSIIIVPPWSVKDEDGNYDVIKIPLPPGVGDLASLVRRPIEQAKGLDEVKFREIAQSVIGSVSPIKPTLAGVTSTLTPQFIKPTLQALTNKDFFWKTPIVPRGKENLSPSLQVRESTSGTARKLGQLLGVSPIKAEKFVRDTFGGVGSQALNLSDRVLSEAGVIPEDQIGGESISEGISKRFTKARGGEKENQAYEIQDELARKNADAKESLKQDYGLKTLDFDTMDQKAIESFTAYSELPQGSKNNIKMKLKQFSETSYKALRKLELADKYPDADPYKLKSLLNRKTAVSNKDLYAHRRRVAILNGASPDEIPSEMPKGWSRYTEELPTQRFNSKKVDYYANELFGKDLGTIKKFVESRISQGKISSEEGAKIIEKAKGSISKNVENMSPEEIDKFLEENQK